MHPRRFCQYHYDEQPAGVLRRAPSQPPLAVEELEPRTLLSHTLIIGHRGNSGEAPADTLVALDQAFDRGADVVEADIHLSADGVPVVMHDHTVDQTTDGTGRVDSLTIEQLKSLDAGSWKDPKYAGERVPTLAEALQAVRGRGVLYLDPKVNGLGAAMAQVLDDLDLPERAVWAAANTDDLVSDIHQHLPGTPILWWGPVPAKGTAGYFQSMRDKGVTGFDLQWGKFSRAFFRAARANGMFFSAYTINRTRDLRAALRLHLDAIETDFPGVLSELLVGPTDHVNVWQQGDELFVRGDNYDNNLRIEGGLNPATIRVTGEHGTLVNDQSAALEFIGVRNIHVLLEDGNDVVRIVDAVLEGGLFLDSGKGTDHITLEHSHFENAAHLIGGCGLDWLVLEEFAVNSVVIDQGAISDWGNAGMPAYPTHGSTDPSQHRFISVMNECVVTPNWNRLAIRRS